MKIVSARFLTSAVAPSQYPAGLLPEVAFSGRSNVGKSSLINALLGRKGLVKTSSTPGRTQTLNFFEVNEAFVFVDLPGYGWAKAPEAVRRRWRPMVESYLSERAQLKGVVVIMDIRREPSEGDIQLLEWLAHKNIPAIRVLTKADKISQPRRLQQFASVRRKLPFAGDEPVLFSAVTGEGKKELWKRLLPLVTPGIREVLSGQ